MMIRIVSLPRFLPLYAFLFSFLIAMPATASNRVCSSSTASGQSTTEIKFKDFFKQPIGPAGLEFTESLLGSNGKAVCILGYMVKQESDPIGRFILAPLPLEMHEHFDGEADDLPASAIFVYLDPGQKTLSVAHTAGLLAIQGIIKVGRYEDDDGRVSWIQLQLPPEQIKINQPESTPFKPDSHKH